MKWYEVIKKALYIYVHRNEYTYCLGAIGEPVESNRIKNLYEYYYNNGYKEKMCMTYDEWAKVNSGKRCFDCSGFLDFCIGQQSHKYSSWTYGDMKKNASLAEGTACSVLWKKGHVGLDIGYGYFVHFPNWNKTCEFGKIGEYNWTSSHIIKDVDYEGATER